MDLQQICDCYNRVKKALAAGARLGLGARARSLGARGGVWPERAENGEMDKSGESDRFWRINLTGIVRKSLNYNDSSS